MKTPDQIREEIAALYSIADAYPNDLAAQASIAGRINALKWTLMFHEEVLSNPPMSTEQEGEHL